MSFKEIQFPPTYKYSSDSNHIPLEFYENVFPVAKKIDLLLGYFSSNAFKVLSRSFAEFIINGGTMRIVTNHVYSLKDKENLIDQTNLKNEDQVIDIFGDLAKLEHELSDYGQHFFDCLRFLIKERRLEILPVKFNGIDLAHSKKMILFDGENYISTDGSINFTLNALTKNSESFEVNAPWEGEIFAQRTQDEKENFDKIFAKSHSNYEYISAEKIEVVINRIGKSKEIIDLIDDSMRIDNSEFGSKVRAILERRNKRFFTRWDSLSEKIKDPRFPYASGPRAYQSEAYKRWVINNYSGVFAMATGTGKTITSLNCLLNLYKESKTYHAIILVPSIALLDQWESEVLSFNFNNLLKVGGGNKWEQNLASHVSDFNWGIKNDLIILCTYGSFVTLRFQKYFNKIEKDLLLIADEAHNMGATNIKRKMKDLQVSKRIGLSATPRRVYDKEGTDAINLFFSDKPPYTYEFDMSRALNEGFLCEYIYQPIIVELTEEEKDQYIEISKQLLKFFDFEKKEFKKNPIVEILLLKRKNIIHKATNKVNAFISILKDLEKQDKLKYIFTYIPEGYIVNEKGERQKTLHDFIEAGASHVSDLRMNTYTSEDDDLRGILRGFSEGKIDMLFAMKMLDEGVDVPRAEVGIFCASTGNPRQFIQRRGRLLRKHIDKSFALIYDMVVIPKLSGGSKEFYNMEKSLVKNELQRVAYFASLAMNYYDTRKSLEVLLEKYELNLETIINEL